MKIYVEPTDPEKMFKIGKILDKKGFLWGNISTSIFEYKDVYKHIFCTKPFEYRLCVEILPNRKRIYTSGIRRGYTLPTKIISDEQFLQILQNKVFILNGGDTEWIFI